jgi:hypothetical protein
MYAIHMPQHTVKESGKKLGSLACETFIKSNSDFISFVALLRTLAREEEFHFHFEKALRG